MTEVYSELEQTLIRELDAIASELDVPALPDLPAPAPERPRWQSLGPVLVAAVALVAVMATVGALLLFTGGDDAEEPAPAPTTAEDDGPVSTSAPTDPAAVNNDLYVGGRKVPGRWQYVRGTGTRWIGQRDDGSWWWGYDAEPQQMERAMNQPPTISPNGRYLARVGTEAGTALLTGADTDEGGEGLGGVELPVSDAESIDYSVVPAVTDDGLVVARNPEAQLLWRPLVDGETVDLTETAPNQVVLANTAAGLLVNQGRLDATDGTQGDPYLARLDEDGTLIKIASVPTHDALEASEEWLAYVPAGTVGGEASAAGNLRVQRIDGSDDGTLTPPDGWVFVAPGFHWESEDRLVATVVAADGSEEGLVRCRPEPASCVQVDLP